MAIIIVGETGVGKSTVGKLLSLKTNYNMYEVGHVVKKTYYDSLIEEEKRKNPQENALVSVDNLFRQHTKDYFTKKRLEFVSKIVATEGNDYFVRKLLEMHGTDDIIIVGARSDDELDAISSRLKYPFVVSLTCEDRKQEHRFIDRENQFMRRDTAYKIFNKRIDIEKSWGVNSVLSRCDVVLETGNLYPEEIADIILHEYDRYICEKIQMEGIEDYARRLIR